MDKWFEDNLVCSRDHCSLRRNGSELLCPSGHKYPIVDGIPIMLVHEQEPTHRSIRETYEKVSKGRSSFQSDCIPTPQNESSSESDGIDPFVQKIVAATCGNLYKPAINRLSRYPIPEICLPNGNGELLLDIGCNWGRWSIAAARKGYSPVGIDPNLDGIIAARKVSRQLGVNARYIVADARFLPFASGFFDIVFSNGVLQHFSKENVKVTLNDVARVLKPQGTCLIQMPNKYGIKSLYNQVRRGFREARDFEIRYWTISELRNTFIEKIGQTSFSVDCYFGLGVRKSDIDVLPLLYRPIVHASEILRRLSVKLHWLKYFADSVYVKSIREPENQNGS